MRLNVCGGNIPREEISGLCRVGNKYILLPQNRDVVKAGYVTVVSEYDIEKAMIDTDFCIPKERYAINHLPGITFTYSNPPWYDGFEAITVDNAGNVYITVETKADKIQNCFILKGVLDWHRKEILLTKELAVPRPLSGVETENMGFEAIAYMPDSNRLMAFWEHNLHPDIATALLLDTALNVVSSLKFDSPLFFRITDAFYVGQGRFIVQQFYYHGDRKKYIPDLLKTSADGLLGNDRDVETSCYSALLSLHYANGLIHHKTIISCGYDCVNWEGIAPVSRGVIHISDNNPPRDGITHLEYLPVNF